MNKNKLNQTYRSITPDTAQKEKMLENILSSTTNENSSEEIPEHHLKRSSTTFHKHRPKLKLNYVIVLAACLIGIVLGKDIIFQFNNVEDTGPQGQPPVNYAPQLTDRYIYYQQETYIVTKQIDQIEVDLLTPIGTIEKIVTDGSKVNNQDLAATAYLGGVVYQTTTDDSSLRLVLEFEGHWYLVENIEAVK